MLKGSIQCAGILKDFETLNNLIWKEIFSMCNFEKWFDGQVEEDGSQEIFARMECSHPSRNGECTISCPFRKLMDVEKQEINHDDWANLEF